MTDLWIGETNHANAENVLEGQSQSFYVNGGEEQHRLGADEDSANKEYHRLLAGEIPVTSKTTVAVLATQFLEWTKDNRSVATWKWY